MDTTPTFTEWTRKMADAVQHKARAKEQRHQAAFLNQAQAEDLWVKGMDQAVQTLGILVQALKHTGHFPQLTLLTHARSPQGTTTYSGFHLHEELRLQFRPMFIRFLSIHSSENRCRLVACNRKPLYMRRGTLLSLKGLEWESPTIEFEIDTAPPFRPDLLAPSVRVTTRPETAQATGARQELFCFGVSLQGGAIVWQLLNPLLMMPQEGSVEEMLKSFLASLLLIE